MTKEEAQAALEAEDKKFFNLHRIVSTYNAIDDYHTIINQLQQTDYIRCMRVFLSNNDTNISIPTLSRNDQIAVKNAIVEGLEHNIRKAYKEIEEISNEFSN